MAIQNVAQSANLSALVSDYNTRNGTQLTVGQVASANGLSPTAVVKAGSAVTFPDVFVQGQGQAASPATASTQPAFSLSGTPTEEQISQRLASLQEPAAPADNATPQQLAEYQQKLQAYSRTMDMLTKIQEALHEMKKNIIANFRI
jgi:hypothetical protein